MHLAYSYVLDTCYHLGSIVEVISTYSAHTRSDRHGDKVEVGTVYTNRQNNSRGHFLHGFHRRYFEVESKYIISLVGNSSMSILYVADETNLA